MYNIAEGMKADITPSLISYNDPLLTVLVEAKEQQQGCTEDILIPELPLFLEPSVFLATQQQMIDIQLFCTNLKGSAYLESMQHFRFPHFISHSSPTET